MYEERTWNCFVEGSHDRKLVSKLEHASPVVEPTLCVSMCVCVCTVVSEPDPSCGGGGKGLGTILHSSCPQVGMLT